MVGCGKVIFITANAPEYSEARALRHNVLYRDFNLSPSATDETFNVAADHAIIKDSRSSRVIAYALVEKSTNEAKTYHLRDIAVDVNHQLRGVGSSALEQLIAEVRRRGATMVRIRSRLHLRPFYERFGFRFTGPVFLGKLTGIPHVEMRLDLGTHPILSTPLLKLPATAKRLLARQFPASSVFGSWDQAFIASYSALSKLPREVIAAMFGMKHLGLSPAFLHIRNFPVDTKPLGKPHTSFFRPFSLFRSEIVLLALAQYFGEPFAYQAESGDRLIHDIYPKPGHGNKLSGRGSRRELKLHQDIVHLDAGPDFILLYCIHGQSQVSTNLLDLEELSAHLPPSLEDILRAPLFTFPPPPSFTSSSFSSITNPRPIMSDHLDGTLFRIQFNTVTPINTEAEDGLHALQRLICDKNLVRSVVLNTGEMLIIDNKRAAHGRQAFARNRGGAQRWLKRLYIGRASVPSTGIFDRDKRTIALAEKS